MCRWLSHIGLCFTDFSVCKFHAPCSFIGLTREKWPSSFSLACHSAGFALPCPAGCLFYRCAIKKTEVSLWCLVHTCSSCHARFLFAAVCLHLSYFFKNLFFRKRNSRNTVLMGCSWNWLLPCLKHIVRCKQHKFSLIVVDMPAGVRNTAVAGSIKLAHKSLACLYLECCLHSRRECWRRFKKVQ